MTPSEAYAAFEELYIEYMGSVDTKPDPVKLMQMAADPRLAEILLQHGQALTEEVHRRLGI